MVLEEEQIPLGNTEKSRRLTINLRTPKRWTDAENEIDIYHWTSSLKKVSLFRKISCRWNSASLWIKSSCLWSYIWSNFLSIVLLSIQNVPINVVNAPERNLNENLSLFKRNVQSQNRKCCCIVYMQRYKIILAGKELLDVWSESICV